MGFGAPQIGALSGAAPTPIGGNALTMLGAAAQNFPLQQQAQQMQQLAMAEQKSQVGQKLYEQIGQVVSADPSKAADPALVQRALQIAKMTGLPPPIKQDGGRHMLDLDVLVPHQDFNSLTPQEKMSGLALPKEQRKAVYGNYRNVDPSWLGAEQYVQPNAGSLSGITNKFQNDINDLSLGKLDPVRFAANVRAYAQPLKAMGVDINQYLSPDFLNASLSKYGDAQVDRLKAIGVHLNNEDQLKARIEADKRDEFGKTLGFKYQDLGVRKELGQQRNALTAQKFAFEQQRAAQTLALSRERLTATERNLDSLIANRPLMVSPGGTGIVVNAYRQTNDLYKATQREYDHAVESIQNAANNGGDVDPRLLDLVDPANPNSLRTQLDTLGAKLGAIGTSLPQQQGRAVQNVTGQTTTIVKPTPSFDPSKATRTGKMNGKKVYQMPDGHVYDESGAKIQ